MGIFAGTPNFQEGGGSSRSACAAPLDEPNEVSGGWLFRRDVGDLDRRDCERGRGDSVLVTAAPSPAGASAGGGCRERDGDNARQSSRSRDGNEGIVPRKEMEPGREWARLGD